MAVTTAQRLRQNLNVTSELVVHQSQESHFAKLVGRRSERLNQPTVCAVLGWL
jgi:hypothetical protein